MNVLLAGGGSAGHVSPLLALADRLVADDPDTAVLVLGYGERASRPGWCRPVATGCYEIPRVPLPRRPRPTPLRLPAAWPPRSARRGPRSHEVAADVVVGFGGYVSAPAYLAARRGRSPDRGPRAEQPAGIRQPARCPADPLGRGQLPRHAACGTRCGPGCRCDRRSPGWTGPRPGLSARAGFGLDPDRRTLLVFGGSLGAQRLNQVCRRWLPSSPRTASRCCTLSGTGKIG